MGCGGLRDGANFAGNAENQNTNLLHFWHKQHTHGSGAKSSKTPLGKVSTKWPKWERLGGTNKDDN